MVQPTQAQAKSRLQANDSVWRALKLDFLLVHCVGRMIGGNRIDDPVEKSLDHGIAVSGRAQRRTHLGIGVVRADMFVGQ